ncbi:cupin domain-containing protein [Klenkia terrae]|uniref:cupin domain-containing protein n=1 Tax=Klenkia terrae TaxID=1052259 RepID=UPI0036098522
MRAAPVQMHGMTMWPLSTQPGGLQAYKLLIPAGSVRGEPDQKTHEGYDWLYVLSGRLRLVLAEHDLVLGRGRRRSSTPGRRTGSAAPTTSRWSC